MGGLIKNVAPAGERATSIDRECGIGTKRCDLPDQSHGRTECSRSGVADSDAHITSDFICERKLTRGKVVDGADSSS